ncbi:Uncharacterised protein [Candidatus Ornithobacterium hominis]|uniref:Fibrobacter succinogenes major paralogous domain-containing protein n=1 Tax=Candidatus Ornithobacterium hominis TaxID=2497989 RepID=A0A383U4A9_9FLAO|nr:hypothetical protein [Candidatus Ornithobacterium hominis]MCT7905276.1 hypothetical protein [Candidatus Ornithobacterium hominis]CAI9429933.1 Fibrobacter succinogenes major paralogous domain [Candidatus Ornithobacterium hominis]SZD74370.1 Uncharacterised protein [Candidatus Ornithobacterium hominis]
MKKLLLSLAVLSGAAATAQVGINTDAPEATLDIRAKEEEDQKGDLRIEGVEKKEKTDWVLIWEEEDKKVKRISLSDLKWEIIVDEGKINYIREKYPKKATKIIDEIKKCAPRNVVFDKHFGDGKHDFVYCAKLIKDEASNYSKTWLNFDLGAEYANIKSDFFNLTKSLDREGAHADERTHGSLFQWQRAADGHEFKDSPTTTEIVIEWGEYRNIAGKFVTGSDTWVDASSGGPYDLWINQTVNNPCPAGWKVIEEKDLPSVWVKNESFGEYKKISVEKLKGINLGFPPYRKSDGGYDESGAYWTGEAGDRIRQDDGDWQGEYDLAPKPRPAISWIGDNLPQNAITEGKAIRCVKD